MSSVSSTSSNSYYYAMQKKAFDKLDTDQNGSLNEKEYQAGKPKNTAAGKDQTAALYEALDTDKSGTVTMDEYAAGTQTAPSAGLLNQLSSGALDVLMQLKPQDGSTTGGDQGSASDAVYDVLDINKDGVISEEEFLAGHTGAVSDADAKKLFENIDSDKDGNIDRDQMKVINEATTPPRLMGPDFFAAQSGGTGSSSGGISALFGSTSTRPDSALRLFDLLENDSVSAGTSSS